MKRLVAVLCCCLLIGAAGATIATTADSAYSVSISGSMETPEQTRTVDGTTYTVDSITRVNQGDSVDVQTTGPENKSYRVYVYGNNNGQQNIIDDKFVDIDDSGAVSFDTSSYEPGSYVVAIEGGKDPQPFVVSAYDVSVSSPDSAPATGTIELSVSLTETTGDTSVHGVEIAVFTEDTVERVDTTKTDGSYVGELDLDSLSVGEYKVQAVVYSPEAAPQGKQEVIGISDPTTLTIESAPQTTTPSNGGGGGGGGGGAPAGTATTTSTAPQNQTATMATQTADEATATTEASATTSPPQTTSSDTVSPTATTQAGVITPNTETAEPTASSNGVVGATPLLLLALLATIALLIRTTDP